MRRIALLPLDDRPCNRIFPRRLADIAGIRLKTPPVGLLGRFTRPGDCDALADWLLQTSRNADGLIVSLDMLDYGGLIASRTHAVPLRRALARLSLMKRIRREHPGLPIFAFSIIMRLGITVESEEAARLHEDIRRWAELVDAVERLGRSEHRAELRALDERLPARVRDEYLRLRQRNHAVNMAAVTLAGEGTFDYLVVAQEDAAPTGLHIPEQQRLRSAVRRCKAHRRVSIHPGADEVGMVLLARHLCARLTRKPAILPVYASPRAEEAVAGYEDRPIGATVKAQIGAAGARIPRGPSHADTFLLVHAPLRPPAEAAQAQRHPHPAKALARFVRQVERHMHLAPVAVADCAYSNGADPALIHALEESALLPRLHAYAAWNTAGNTIGTAVAHAIARLLAPDTPRAQRAHKRFLLERLLDDYAYQAVIRQEAAARAQRQGLSPLNLRAKRPELQRFVAKRLAAMSRSLWRSNFAGRPPAIRARLPWPRLFEAEVSVNPRDSV